MAKEVAQFVYADALEAAGLEFDALEGQEHACLIDAIEQLKLGITTPVVTAPLRQILETHAEAGWQQRFAWMH